MSYSINMSFGVLVLLAISGIVVVGQDSKPAPAPPPPLVPGEGRQAQEVVHEYVGSKKCRMCHGQWHKSWQESVKGRSFQILKPGARAEHKQKVGLDSKRDYTSEAACLTCHTVGFGQPGGYRIPPPNDEKAKRFAATREGVGCEACHGPGGGFTQVMGDIYLKERPYEQQEVRRAGLRSIEPQLCLDCHDSKAPCIADDRPPLKVDDDALRTGLGFHQHFPLKFRKQ
ncbi:MAG: cytochrome c family protein [Planctomycetota bacterium]|nr:cytochrome c family protein [Planctomycetota bacterium]